MSDGRKVRSWEGQIQTEHPAKGESDESQAEKR